MKKMKNNDQYYVKWWKLMTNNSNDNENEVMY